MNKILILTLALTATAMPGAVLAGEKNHVSTNQHVFVSQNGRVVTDRHSNVVVENGRVLVNNNSARRCPPGLAKKNNACMPPGQYKKMRHYNDYEVGDVLDDDVMIRRVPSYALRRLDPAPYGYEYVRVNNDILLVEKQTNEIDAIIALMNLNR